MHPIAPVQLNGMSNQVAGNRNASLCIYILCATKYRKCIRYGYKLWLYSYRAIFMLSSQFIPTCFAVTNADALLQFGRFARCSHLNYAIEYIVN